MEIHKKYFRCCHSYNKQQASSRDGKHDGATGKKNALVPFSPKWSPWLWGSQGTPGLRWGPFLLSDLPLGNTPTPWRGTQGDGDPTGLLAPLPGLPGRGSQADLRGTCRPQVARRERACRTGSGWRGHRAGTQGLGSCGAHAAVCQGCYLGRCVPYSPPPAGRKRPFPLFCPPVHVPPNFLQSCTRLTLLQVLPQSRFHLRSLATLMVHMIPSVLQC